MQIILIFLICDDSLYVESVNLKEGKMNKVIVTLVMTMLTLSVFASNSLIDSWQIGEYEDGGIPTRSFGLQFTLISNGTAYSVSGGTSTATEIVIPATYNFLPVTAVGASAFYHYMNLTSVVIPESVTTIGNEAFRYCNALTSVTLPNSLISIGSYAFGSCYSLEDVVIPDNVRTIATYAFLACRSLTNVVIPNSVTSIGTGAFQACDILENVSFGSGVTNISSIIFVEPGLYSCPALSSLTVDINNPVYFSEGNCIIRRSNNSLVLGCKNSIIPNTVAHIGDSAFERCVGLENIIIPESVISIGNFAFMSCTNLSNITISEGVNTFGRYAFGHCYNLTSFNIPSSVDSMGEYAFYYCTGLSEINIPDSIHFIGPKAFVYCTGLTNIVIPNSVISIGEEAFSYCTNLSSIVIPASVINIGAEAFYNCFSLTIFTEHISPPAGWVTNWNIVSRAHMNIPNIYAPVVYGSANAGLLFTLIEGGSAYEVSRGTSTDSDIVIPTSYNSLPVIKVANIAFYNSLTLTSITIPSGIQQIGINAFVGCENLSSIHIPASVIDIETGLGWSSFRNVSGLVSITVDPDNIVYRSEGNCLIQISNNTVILGCQNSIIPEGILGIGTGAFQGCKNLTSISIPNGVTSIGAAAFQYCTSLTSVVMPNSVVSMGTSTFERCTNLVSVTLSAQLTTIPWCAFNDCYSLQGIDIPDSVRIIESEAFDDNYDLTEVNIGNGVTQIEFYAFYGCRSLTSLSFGSSIQIIDDLAFNFCTAIRNLSVSENHPYLYSEGNCIINRYSNTLVFGCNNSIIPAGVTSIGPRAFYICQNFSEITIPESVTSIGELAFSSCRDLEYVFIGSNVTNVGRYAFINYHLVVFTEHTSLPTGWDVDWAGSGTKVVWGVTMGTVAPSNLVIQVNDSVVNLSWTPPNGVYIPNFISYAVYRDGVAIANIDITNPSFTDIAVSADNHSYYVTAIYTTGESDASNVVQTTSDIDIVSMAVTSLTGNYPNPFNPTTTISYEMARKGYVTIVVYNSKGQRVAGLVDGVKGVGVHNVVWNGQDESGRAVSSGVYFYRMTTGDFVSVKKMVMVK